MNFILYLYHLESDKCSLYQNSVGPLQHTVWLNLESQNYALHTSYQSLRARIDDIESDLRIVFLLCLDLHGWYIGGKLF